MSEAATINFGDLLVSPPEYGANATAIAPEDGNPRYLRITDIDDEGCLLHDDIKSISAIVAQPYLLAQDDIVIARTGNTVGKAYRHDTSNGPLAFAGYLVRFRLDQNKADPGFVSQFLHSPHYRAWVQRTLRTGAQPNINAAEYKKLPIPTFKPNTQRRIATILTTMDEVIEATEKLVEKHQQIKAGLMHDLYTRGLWTRPELARGDHKGLPCEATAQEGQLRPAPEEAPELYQDSKMGLMPKAWIMQSLLSIASYQHGRPFPSSDYSDSGVVLLRPGNLHPTGIVRYDNRHTTRIPRKWVNECPDLVVSVNDILMNLTAQSLDDQFLGRVCIVQDEEPAMLNQRIARFTPKGIHHHYLYWLLRSVQFRRQIDRTSQGTKVQHIYNSDLNKISFAVPTDPVEQRAMSEILYSATEQLETYEDNLAKLRQQKQGLMHDLLTGRVRTNGLAEPRNSSQS